MSTQNAGSDGQSFHGYVGIREERGDYATYLVVDPDTSTTLGVQSTDSADTSIDVTIENRDGSISETITTDGTDGTTFVTGSQSFTTIGKVTLSTSASGDVEIHTDDSGSPGTLLGSIPAGSTSFDKAPSQFVDAVSEGFSGDRQPTYLNTIRGRQTYQVRAGPYVDDGGVEFMATPEGGLPDVLKGVLGSSSVSTSDPDNDSTDEVGTHTFTPNTSLPTFQVEVGMGSLDAVRHLGAVIDSVEFSHSQGEELTVSPSIPASRPVIQGNQLSPTYDALKSFSYHNASFTIDGTDRTADVQEWTTTLSNGASLEHRNSVTASKVFIDTVEVVHTVTLDFENMDLWKKFFGDTSGSFEEPSPTMGEVNCVATWTGDETIADTDTNHELKIDTPRTTMNTHTANLNQNDLVAENLEFRALYDIGGIGNTCEVTLTNGVLTAY